MSSAPTADTHGLMAPSLGRRVNLRGLPLGLPAGHDPRNSARVAFEAATGPTGIPLSMLRHPNLEDAIVLELEWVTHVQFQEYAALVRDLRGGTVKYSPLGTEDYLDEEWMLVSTTAGWRETAPRRWAGPLELWRQGEAVT